MSLGHHTHEMRLLISFQYSARNILIAYKTAYNDQRKGSPQKGLELYDAVAKTNPKANYNLFFIITTSLLLMSTQDHMTRECPSDHMTHTLFFSGSLLHRNHSNSQLEPVCDTSTSFCEDRKCSGATENGAVQNLNTHMTRIGVSWASTGRVCTQKRKDL